MTLTLPQRRQFYHHRLNIMTSTLIVWVLLIPSSLALPTSPMAVAAFVPASRSTSRWYSSSRSRIFHDNPITSIRPLQLSEKDDYSLNHYSDCNNDHIQFQDLDANDQHTNRSTAKASSKQHNEQYRTSPESLTPAKTRRQFFQQQIIASSATLFPTYVNAASTSTDEGTSAIDNYFSLRNNNNIPYAQRKQLARQQQQQQQQFAKDRQKANDKAISSSKKLTWTPFVNVNKWDSVETCLLEMLPVRNGVFRKLQDLIEELEICEADDADGWKQTLLDTLTTLSLLSSKRSSLEPVFNQQDPTELFINKSTIGERNIEVLRSNLEDLVKIASGGMYAGDNIKGRDTVNSGNRRNNIDNSNNNPAINFMDDSETIDVDVAAFREGKRKALFALSEVGELLVPSFPYAVPTRGKFGYLPRLLGRCTVTLLFERPSSSSSTFGASFGGDKQSLGNVTIVADGYAAPITAGNFVDLSMRNFYTGLSVKAMRKRLGVIPSQSDNVIVNDLTELKDNLDVLKDDFESALPGGNYGSGGRGAESDKAKDAKSGANRGIGGIFRSKQSAGNDPFGYSNVVDDSQMMMDVVLPVLGSFQEGFYDPLTAKPRRIPLEVVALGRSGPNKATLTYSSSFASLDDDVKAAGTTKYSALTSSSSPQRSFSSSTTPSSSNSTTTSSSNFRPVLSFDIPNIVAMNHPDRVSNGGSSEFFSLPIRDISPKRTELLDGQYAPFGYIVKGADVYQSLRPGDVISATYVSDLGALNLVKIRKNAFDGDEEVNAEDGQE